jgi:hypothetical protein
VFDPKLTDPHPECAKTQPLKVYCSLHNCDAQIVIANWPFSDEGWSDWRVIDCSLLPPGEVHCGMDCLSEARVTREPES